MSDRYVGTIHDALHLRTKHGHNLSPDLIDLPKSGILHGDYSITPRMKCTQKGTTQ